MNEEIQTQVPQGTPVEENNKPVKTYTCKGGVQATVWSKNIEKDGKQIEVFNITVERRYTDDNGISWKATSSFRPDDLPKVALVSEQAFKYIVMKQMGN